MAGKSPSFGDVPALWRHIWWEYHHIYLNTLIIIYIYSGYDQTCHGDITKSYHIISYNYYHIKCVHIIYHVLPYIII
jgi:hypothetical protein